MNTASALGTDGRARWSLRLLGGFELSLLPSGEKVAAPGKRERVLLAYLALHPKGREQRRKLTTLLWGDAADETTLENLRNCLYGLRKTLGDSEHRVIASEGEDIVLDGAAFEVDVLAFRRLAAQSSQSELEEAAKLYSGGLLDGLDIESEEFESWRRSEATRCRDQAVDVLSRVMTQLSDAGETERAIESGERLLRLDPLHESAVRRLMRLYAGSDRRSTAIQLYRTLGDALKADLGAQPEAETRAVFAEITRGEETPAPITTAATLPPPPSASIVPANGVPSAPLTPAPPSLAPEHRLPAISAPQHFASLRSRARPLRWVLAGSLAAAVMAVFLIYQFVPSFDSPAGNTAVAVLPFDNLSSDPEQEFFSAGITQEIVAVLASISVPVVARRSAAELKDENSNIQDIAKALNATHLLDGSVRKAGDRVRITAQLIRADDGRHVWAETYDRNLTDIFAIQEEIARAIATALRVVPGLRQGDNRNRTTDPETYQLYLGARTHLRAYRSRPGEPIGMLEQAVARDPDYAPAWALLADAYGADLFNVASSFDRPLEESRRIVDASLSKAELAARQAIELDTDFADGYASLANVQSVRGKYLEAEGLYSKALTLDADSPDALAEYSDLLAGVGRIEDAVAMKQRLLALEPFVPTYNQGAGWVLWLNGQNDAAIAIYKAMNPVDRGPLPANLYASLGRYGEAADELASRNPASVTASILRTAPAKAASPESLPRLDLTSFVYLYVGASDRFLEPIERQVAAGYVDTGRNAEVWHPSGPYAAVRRTERFKAFARNAGLVEYWRAKGWPEFCRPVGPDDFVCD